MSYKEVYEELSLLGEGGMGMPTLTQANTVTHGMR